MVFSPYRGGKVYIDCTLGGDDHVEGRCVIPPEGISGFGLSKMMMMGVWIGMVLGVSKRICLLVTSFLQDPVLLIGIPAYRC